MPKLLADERGFALEGMGMAPSRAGEELICCGWFGRRPMEWDASEPIDPTLLRKLDGDPGTRSWIA